MSLHAIELEILNLHNGLCLKPTIETAARIGTLLAEAKKSLPHGAYLPWVRRLGLHVRSAQVYLQIANAKFDSLLDEQMSIQRFLQVIRQAKRRANRQDRDERRQDLADDPTCKIVNADCRQYRWPRKINVVATDPPWSDSAAYQWLATFAASHLVPGGLLLCQVGTRHMADRLITFQKAGLVYQWCLCIVLTGNKSGFASKRFQTNWRGVVVMSKGKPDWKRLNWVTDTVTADKGEKDLHVWQQPAAPWRKWLTALTCPGDSIADPFAGSGTLGAVCKSLGDRKYLGTEIDPGHAETAKKRIRNATQT